MNAISRNELKQRLDAGEPITLVEALPQRYFEAEHLPGAINIPHDEIRERAADQLPDKDATIVVYCASTACQNSAIGTQILTAMGYRQVFEYVEGKQDWKDAGYSLAGGRA
jgi:rhodanese-related sulfurtransferase